MDKFTRQNDSASRTSKNSQPLVFEPRREIIQNILNYSKAAFVKKSTLIGKYVLVMN